SVEQIELEIFSFRKHLKPFLKRSHINRAHFVSLPKQIRYEMAANKAASATDHNLPRSHSRIESRYRAEVDASAQIISSAVHPHLNASSIQVRRELENIPQLGGRLRLIGRGFAVRRVFEPTKRDARNSSECF